jgi:hypothetical protein
MFKRVRQLHISLAAKCQLLFGAAVITIIAAALFVPFQRMEQLTEQLNEKSAAALVRTTLGNHIAEQTARRNGAVQLADNGAGRRGAEPGAAGGSERQSPSMVKRSTRRG